MIPLVNNDIVADDIEMQEEFYQYYGTAPVTAWVYNADLAEGLKPMISAGHKSFTFASNEDDAKATAVTQALEWCKT